MKKLVILTALVAFTASVLTSCKHGACAGVTTHKVEKVKVSSQRPA